MAGGLGRLAYGHERILVSPLSLSPQSSDESSDEAVAGSSTVCIGVSDIKSLDAVLFQCAILLVSVCDLTSARSLLDNAVFEVWIGPQNLACR
mmetsp:Transcript_6236/g.26375  ORF Transcript_6236/g.26375 Transcript_6236/m.26375 type:complete len:93 (-) Transcript_6236:1068-1346(-)